MPSSGSVRSSSWIGTIHINAEIAQGGLDNFEFPRDERFIYCKYALELSEVEKPHIQFCLATKQMRFGALAKILPGAHIEPILSIDREHIFTYPGNPEFVYKSGDKAGKKKGGSCIWCKEFGDSSLLGSGRRTDLISTDSALWEIKEIIDSGGTLRDCWNKHFPIMVRHHRGVYAYSFTLSEPVNEYSNTSI